METAVTGKSRKKWIILGIVAAAILIPVIIIMIRGSADKEFSYKELHITLNGGYSEPSGKKNFELFKANIGKSQPNYTLLNSDNTVYIYRYDKAESSYANLDEFAEYKRASYKGNENAQIISRNNYRYIIANGKMTNDKDAKSVVAFYESKNAFWIVETGGYASQFSESQNLKYTDSVKFKE